MIYHGEYPPHPRIENQALHLIKNNVEVFLFCVTYKKNEATESNYKGINLVKVYFPPIVYQLSALAYSFPFYNWAIKKKVENFITKNEITHLHVHNMVIAQTVFELNRKLCLPLVFDIHENIPEIMKHYPHLKTLLGKILISPKKWKLKESTFILKANKVIVVTEDAKEEIINRTKISNEKIKVLPNFTNSTFIKQSYSKALSNKFNDKFNVLYIGDTGERRGLASVVRAVKYLKETIPQLAIIIVGKSKDDDGLKKLINKEEAKSYIFMEGWVPEDMLADYVHIADVGLCPILRNLHHDTTYANKLFQYAMHGKPILASDCPSQAKLINKNKWGLIHKANDAEDFAEKLLLLYTNKAKRVSLGNNGKESIESKYNFESSNFNNLFYKNLNQ